MAVECANHALIFGARHVRRPGGSRPHESKSRRAGAARRSEEHTSELQSRGHLVCRLLLEKKKKIHKHGHTYSFLNSPTEFQQSLFHSHFSSSQSLSYFTFSLSSVLFYSLIQLFPSYPNKH